MDANRNPKEFENTVAELLSLAGLDVQGEQILGHKRIDLYAVDHRLGAMHRIAVECKYYQGPLTQKELSQIYANYLPLYQQSLIDQLLIVTERGLAPSALSMVGSTRELHHLTLAELQNLVMDFRPYLLGLTSQYEEDGFSAYYVPVKTRDGTPLQETVMNWIANGGEPLAILGSYGMGKTTFARHLSQVLASDSLAHANLRIPIYVRLGDISAEQSLEGLLGKLFTSVSVVRNYTFDAFMALNIAGRFVIILDGFDEMKHTLSWDEFKFNFQQMNRLVKGQSRVIILGRPTAFLSDEEHNHALRGIKCVQGREFREPDWPTYNEIYLGAFDRLQIVTFLERYLAYSRPEWATEKGQRRISERVNAQIEQMSGKQLFDIARRPVQLRMLAEVLPQWRGDIDKLTTTILYSIFIDTIIEREQAKLARRHFGVKERRSFARDIAWWLWTDESKPKLTGDTIPDEILTKYLDKGDDPEAVRRDLVAACFLERKIGGSLYFPHRSFQEYLVAEELARRLSKAEVTLELADRLCTEEVGIFLSGIVGSNHLAAWERVLEKHAGVLSGRIARLWTSGSHDYLFEKLKESNNPWYALFLCITVANQLLPTAETVLKVIEEKRAKSTDVLYVVLCHLCTTMLCAQPNRSLVLRPAQRIEESLVDLCRVSLGETYTRNEKTFPDREKRIIQAINRRGHGMTPDGRVIRLVSRIIISRTKGVIDLSGTYRVLLSILKDYCLIADWVSGGTLKLEQTLQLSKVNFAKKSKSAFEVPETFQQKFVPEPELIGKEEKHLSSAHHRRDLL
jgi:energy-coupling factor transporter ATP-binding protein EcfA2